MKPIFWFALAGAAAFLTGCEDIGERVRGDKLLGEDPPQVRTYAADSRATYDAAQVAIKQMGYRFTHGGPAQGELWAVSSVGPGDQPDTAHQFTLRAEFHPTLDGTGTEVSVRMTEILEADSFGHQGQGTEAPLHDTGLPQVFLDAIQAALPAQGLAKKN